MARHEDDVEEALQLQGQALIWKQMFAFADSMALRCAVELHIADILHSHPHPLTLSQLASGIASTTAGGRQPLDIPCLARIMRLLVRKGVFAVHHSPGDKEPHYGPTHASSWLLRGGDGDDDLRRRRRQQPMTLAPMVLVGTHPIATDPWQYLSRCVVEGGVAFEKCHGCEIWDVMAIDPEFNRVFNDGMACTATITMKAVTQCYEDGLAHIGSLVDVGGGTGTAIAEVVKAFPHVRGINFDLPHVIATAPEIPGVSHVAGDMFREVPKADAVMMKV